MMAEAKSSNMRSDSLVKIKNMTCSSQKANTCEQHQQIIELNDQKRNPNLFQSIETFAKGDEKMDDVKWID